MLTTACALLEGALLHAAPFTNGNVVIYRVGDGGSSLLNTGAPVFLDEYTPAGVLVQSIAMPTVVNGAHKRLVASGTATSEGLLTRSADGRYLVASGYDATPPFASSISGSTSATVNRVIGRVDAAGNVDTTTALTDAATGNNPRSAVSSNGTDFWITGGAGGIRYTALGGTTSTQISTTLTNLRQAAIFGGQLYVSTSSGTAVRIGTVGTGLPSTSGQTIANLPGFGTTGTPDAFAMVDLNPAVPGPDTLYVSDETSATGGIQKFSLVSGNWTANGVAGAGADAYRGLTAVVRGTTVTLYATRNGGSGATGGGELVTLVDSSGYNASISGAPTLLATAAANTAFRGVALAPGPSSINLAQYVRIGRYDLPEPTRTTAPTDNLLCQEASGVAYNWDTDTLFVVGDGGRSVTQVSKTGVLINTMTLASGSSPQGTEFYDTEGITYIGGGQFVMTEERDRQLVKFTYVAGTTLNRATTQTVKIGTFSPNQGTEGLSWDPQTGGFICLKEISPIGIFQTGVDFNLGTATNGSPTTENSVNLFDPALLGMTDVADVFALSNLPSISGQTQAGNLLVLSQENARIVNIDRSGNIASTLQIVSDPGNPLAVADQQHEGLTMDRDGLLYVVSENGGGDIDHPQLWVYALSTVPNAAPTAIALNNAITSIPENSSTVNPIKVADIVVTDDGLGVNQLSVTGADAAFFEINASALYIKAGTVLDYETKTSYAVTVEVDDTTIGSTPDASLNYTLNVTDIVNETVVPALIISEVAPWSSSSGLGVLADWFEVTNTGTTPVDITGWKVDDSSASFGSALALNGVTSIAPGESVIFIESSTPVTTIDAFKTLWFGSSPPAGLQIGTYSGSGIGLSSGGDAVNLYDAGGALKAGVTFGPSPSGPVYPTFNNAVGLDGTAISVLSIAGVHGAFRAAGDANEIGSPGTTGKLFISEVAPWGSGATSYVADWFELTNAGARPVDITGWKIDDGSNLFASATTLEGITSIAPGESVIFMETATPGDLAAKAALFLNSWFGASPPAGLQIGSYSGGGLGLSTGGDAVNIFNASGTLVTGVAFGTATTNVSFDNHAAIGGNALPLPIISTLSVAGTNGAFVAANASETGSPGTTGKLIITEVAPWSSGSSPVAADWFEVTHTGATAVDITGWKVDDNSESPVAAVALNGITSIAPGESVIFIESATPLTTVPAFLSNWFGASPPAGLQVGTYTGSGIGLSSGGDAVNLYDTNNVRQANVSFGASPGSAPFGTFDNAALLSFSGISQLSVPGVNGAFVAVNSAIEVGSPGTIVAPPATFANWLIAHGYNSNGIHGDTDSDGIPDSLEYFFNLNPNSGGNRDNLPQVVLNGSDLEFRFTYLTGTLFPGYLKASTDLVTWVDAVPGLDYEVISETQSNGQTAVRFRIFCNPIPTAAGPFTYLTPFTSNVERGSINSLTITNHGMVGAGRLTGEAFDSFGETLGASSGLSITGWSYNAGTGQFSGTFNVLPDRGYNSGSIFSNYAARIHALPFTFTPYYGAGPVAQNQIVPTYSGTTKFTYVDGATTKFTTGLNPTGVSTILGQSVGTAPAFNLATGTTENLISFDAEALHVFPDGSGFVSDEYGTYLCRFNSSKQITRIVQLPSSAQPHKPAGTLNFDSVNAPTNGRRNNQGLEGMSVSPDNTRLFALMQSALVQDTGSGQQGRYNTRLYVFDIAGANLENPQLIGEYAVQLPRYDLNGNGSGLDTTAAQSEIVALSNTQFLMLPRDGNGLGKGTTDPIVAKTVDLVDFSAATNILGLYDTEGAQISPAAALVGGIAPATSTVVINLLSSTDLAKFGFNTNTASPDQFTVNEKLEGMSLVPDLSTPSPEDYFLFIGNDNDFQSSDVRMIDATGALVSYGDARDRGITNDATFTVWRITICPNNRKFYRIDVDTAP